MDASFPPSRLRPIKPGRGPLGRLLDLFTSITFGVVILTLILIYASIMSAVPSVSRALEFTEMAAFRHWLFNTFIALFVITLTCVTLRRIRWNLINLGVLTVHAGLLVFTGGAVWYFFTKHEGDVRLDSPRVELVSLAGQDSRGVSRVLAEKGQNWSATMPAFGGRVKLEVLEATPVGLQAAAKAKVRVTIGDNPPRDVELSLADKPSEPVHERLAIRLVRCEPKDHFYDDELAALWASNGASEPKVLPIERLPIHVERFSDEGYEIRDTTGNVVHSKRSTPVLDLGGVKIPTGWFENWTLPIAVDSHELPFDVTVTGYLPYVQGMERVAVPGGDKPNPAANIRVEFGGGSATRESLFALDPSASLGSQLNVEYRWVESAEERDMLLRPLAGPHELTVEVRDPPVSKVYSVTQGQTIQVEGTGYELKVSELVPNWPLMSPGFEKARSPVARVDVKGPTKTFNRTVVQRYPQLTQDIDETGMRKKDGPYDPNIVIRYRTSAIGALMLVAGPNVPPQMAMFGIDGRVQKFDVKPGVPQTVGGPMASFTVTVTELIDKAQNGFLPVVVPPDARRPVGARQASAIRLKFTGRGANAGWSQTQWVMRSEYPDLEPDPIVVRAPGDERTWELIYSRYPRSLGATVAVRKLSVDSHPGERRAAAWQSDVLYQLAGDSAASDAHTRTNVTMTIGNWTYFQSGAATDNWSFTVLGVGNRNGIIPMGVGCVMITLGCLFAFYVKPILKRRQAQAALERHAYGPSRAARREPEVVGAER